ncbi:sugar phosphate isomerase/epimerase family protein [Flammeovirgaceae bacterium SG7u.111]|nr:sugar phosphate isomerase/epimerase family protein [Flammeovirgaceae bacterium SG7u.132]WPO38047.1 sugar phosphate isomerase/epimerase family protein [Flammeovirgaceae bacterium SG7u.111]
MEQQLDRREFITKAGKFGLGLGLISALPVYLGAQELSKELFFDISLAQYSYHRALQDREMTNLEFPSKAKELGINAVEYVSFFFKDNKVNKTEIAELKLRTDDIGVQNVLIMCARSGNLASSDEKERKAAVANHYQWVETSSELRGHAIRVDLRGKGSKEQMAGASVKSLAELCDYAKGSGVNILVENHGGASSDGKWLSQVMTDVGLENCGTLPDFGNFTIDRKKNIVYDKYKGIKELMPFAKAVSAKSYDFDEFGEETVIDYHKMLKMVKHAGYKGYVGIEYEGKRLEETEGILATKQLLEIVGRKLS